MSCRPHSHVIASITTAGSQSRKRAGQSQGTTAEAKEKSGGNESQHNLKVMRTTLPAPFQTPPPRSQQCDPPVPRETTRQIELSVRAYRAAHESLFMSHPIRPAPSPHYHRTQVNDTKPPRERQNPNERGNGINQSSNSQVTPRHIT